MPRTPGSDGATIIKNYININYIIINDNLYTSNSCLTHVNILFKATAQLCEDISQLKLVKIYY